MGAGAFIEPLVVVTLLFGGTWINRDTTYRLTFRDTGDSWRPRHPLSDKRDDDSFDGLESGRSSPPSYRTSSSSESSPVRSGSPALLPEPDAKWRKRELRIPILGWRKEVVSPNTAVFRNRFLSRLLRKFPFLVEAWYWALIYWVYQLGRAFTALTLVEGTVNVARKHAVQVIHAEQALRIFYELEVQAFFMQYPMMMQWINRIYSFIHIPGTILFLVWLFFYTTVRNRVTEPQPGKPRGEVAGSPSGPALYEARRRTMAVCNLIAFIVFTLWPCMPPRLLSDPAVDGEVGEEARSFGFVDTVHGKGGESSVWTQNKFCNQYAAMPSLHFGYSLLIGLTIMSIPLSPAHRRSRGLALGPLRLRLPLSRRMACIIVGLLYPFTILIAIVATANHFILDAVAGSIVCGIAWFGNDILLNLLALEDYFLWCVRIDKPGRQVVDRWEGDEKDGWTPGKGVS